MTTSDNSPHEESSASVAPSLTGLVVLNLGVALVSVLLMFALQSITVAYNFRSEGLTKTGLVLPLIVILLSVATATISIWHSGIPRSNESLKKAIGLTSWIMTFVTLGFGVLMLLLVLIIIFRL